MTHTPTSSGVEAEWPERLILRNTAINADEGQRIYTTATGYGFEKREYVRADLAATPPKTVGSGELDAAGLRAAVIAGSDECREYAIPEPHDGIYEVAIRAYLEATAISLAEGSKP